MRACSKMRKSHYEASVGRAHGARMDDLAKGHEAED
jgi:hypothetical protein